MLLLKDLHLMVHKRCSVFGEVLDLFDARSFYFGKEKEENQFLAVNKAQIRYKSSFTVTADKHFSLFYVFIIQNS